MSTAQRSDRVSAALSAAVIAASVDGTVEGDAAVEVSRVASLAAADRSSVSFLGAARYASDASHTNAGVVMVTAALASHVTHVPARIIVQAPQDSILAALALLYTPVPLLPGVHANVVRGVNTVIDASSCIEAGVVLGDGVTIGARTRIASGVVIGGGVSVGDDCVLYPNVTVYAGTTVGDRVQVHAGAVLGSDGFGYAFRDGAHQKIPHVGGCRIESDVEIGANTTVDRGSVDDTVIGAGTKIDNLCHIAHNVQIGRLCLLMAHVGISGSTRLGDGVIVAGQAGLAGHVTVGSGARIAGGSGVFGNVPAGETWSGYPARPHRQWLRAQAALFKLPALLKSLGGQKGSE